MTLDEYKTAIDRVSKQAEREKCRIAKEYAFSNNTVSIGDIVEDHSGKVQVTSVEFYYSMPPSCRYSGLALKKDGTPKKIGAIRTVWQQNLIMNRELK